MLMKYFACNLLLKHQHLYLNLVTNAHLAVMAISDSSWYELTKKYSFA